MLSRRDFVFTCGGGGCALAAGVSAGSVLLPRPVARLLPTTPARISRALLEKTSAKAYRVRSVPQALQGRGSRAWILRRARKSRRRVLDPGVGPTLRCAPGSHREEAALSFPARAATHFPSPPRAATWNASVARIGTFPSRSPRTWIFASCRPTKSCARPRTMTPA